MNCNLVSTTTNSIIYIIYEAPTHTNMTLTRRHRQ